MSVGLALSALIIGLSAATRHVDPLVQVDVLNAAQPEYQDQTEYGPEAEISDRRTGLLANAFEQVYKIDLKRLRAVKAISYQFGVPTYSNDEFAWMPEKGTTVCIINPPVEDQKHTYVRLWRIRDEGRLELVRRFLRNQLRRLLPKANPPSRAWWQVQE